MRLNQHFRSSSGPLQSVLTHNRGMTRFCGWLIILDTHTLTCTSHTVHVHGPQTQIQMNIRKQHSAHTPVCAPTHTHISFPLSVSPHSPPSNAALFPQIHCLLVAINIDSFYPEPCSLQMESLCVHKYISFFFVPFI